MAMAFLLLVLLTLALVVFACLAKLVQAACRRNLLNALAPATMLAAIVIALSSAPRQPGIAAHADAAGVPQSRMAALAGERDVL